MDKDNLSDSGRRLLSVLDEATLQNQKMRLTAMAGSKPNTVRIMTLDQRQRLEDREFAIETARLAKIAELKAEAEFKPKPRPGQVIAPAYEALPAVSAVSVGAGLPDAQPKPKTRFKAQEEAIIQELKNRGFDPLALSKNLPGKPGVKKLIRSALDGKWLFSGTTVFDRAWERLSSLGDIVIKG